MTNRYPGTCYRCGEAVPAGAGVFEKVGRPQRLKWPDAKLPKWQLQHHDCAQKFGATKRHYLYAPDAAPPAID